MEDSNLFILIILQANIVAVPDRMLRQRSSGATQCLFAKDLSRVPFLVFRISDA
jgi:hypothetical protein